jgi:type VI protein secretion system component VasA
MLKFKKNGKVKAVLKDEATEPDGFKYEDAVMPEDQKVPEGVKSLEEIEEELKKKEDELNAV